MMTFAAGSRWLDCGLGRCGLGRLGWWLVLVLVGVAGPGSRAAGQEVSFATQILPLLRGGCFNCHGPEPRPARGNLRLHNAEAIQARPIITPGQPDDSELFKRITLPAGTRGAMPPRGSRLSEEEVTLFRMWIEQGASFDDSQSASSADSSGEPVDGGGSASGGVTFETAAQGILQRRCFRCHGPGPRADAGGLRLHSEEAITASGAVVAGQPDSSELITRVTMERGTEGAMPPQGPGLTEEEVTALREWIEQGAAFGGSSSGSDARPGPPGRPGGGSPRGDSPGTPPVPPRPPATLADRAEQAFLGGRDKDAFNLLYASALSEPDGAKLLGEFRWYPKLRRAALGVRVGIGASVEKEGRWDGDPEPIGSASDGGGGGGGGGDGDGGPTPGAPRRARTASANSGNATLDYYAGEVGAELVKRLKERQQRGDYGAALQRVASGGAGGRRRPRAGAGAETGGAEEQLGGEALGGEGLGGGGGEPDDDSVSSVGPGIVMLGQASRTELLERARSEGLDVLLVIDIQLQRNPRTEQVQNLTKVVVMDVATQSVVGSTKLMNNLLVQRMRERNAGEDPVDVEMKKVETLLDQNFRGIELPAKIQPQHAASRVAKLAQGRYDNPLVALAEMTFYHSRKLVTDDELRGGYQPLLGSAATAQLLSASPAERQKAVAGLTP
ncbi:MAG: c-type cytochrome domain-containing protein [Pirellulales bacterium]